jgi:hypothetical protein
MTQFWRPYSEKNIVAKSKEMKTDESKANLAEFS